MFWNTFICQFVLALFCPFSQITQRVSPYSVVVLFLGLRFSAGPREEFPRAPTLILSLPAGAGCCVGITASCDEDVGDVGEDEVEELVDRPGTTNGT